MPTMRYLTAAAATALAAPATSASHETTAFKAPRRLR